MRRAIGEWSTRPRQWSRSYLTKSKAPTSGRQPHPWQRPDPGDLRLPDLDIIGDRVNAGDALDGKLGFPSVGVAVGEAHQRDDAVLDGRGDVFDIIWSSTSYAPVVRRSCHQDDKLRAHRCSCPNLVVCAAAAREITLRSRTFSVSPALPWLHRAGLSDRPCRSTIGFHTGWRSDARRHRGTHQPR